MNRCLHNETKEKNDEQIPENVAHDTALRVSQSLDAKIPVSGDAREGQRGGGNSPIGAGPEATTSQLLGRG
jgi:hypothetical protein